MGEVVKQLQLERVTPGALHVLWPNVRGALIDHPELWTTQETPEDLFKQLLLGELQLWVFLDEGNIKMYLMTHIDMRPTGMVMKLVWAVGVAAERAAATVEAFERVALTCGCKRLEVWGRAGWARLLRKYGYREVQRIVGRNLDTVSGVH